MNLPTREEAREALAWFEPNLEENIGLTPDHIHSIEVFKKIALAYTSGSLIEARTEGEIFNILHSKFLGLTIDDENKIAHALVGKV
jgi:hypothetical protein